MNAIEFPIINVGGRELTVRMSIAAQLLMARRGLDIYKLSEELNPKMVDPAAPADAPRFLPNPRYADNLMVAFSACVAENLIDMSNPDRVDLSKAPSADYWACQLHPLQFVEVQNAIIDALKKVSEVRRAALHIVAPPIPAEAAS